jgi:hypothetical protein
MRSSFVIRFLTTLVVSIAVVVGSGSVRGAGLSIDQSDLWWNPAESGWGIQFVHTGSAIFATMYVYGPWDSRSGTARHWKHNRQPPRGRVI